MKYITLEYDMNSPRDKAVSVPLDSDYGLAVKVYKNGALLQSTISVDQQAALSNYRGWQLFELSSGSQPCQKLVKVQAAEVVGAHYGHTWTEHVENEHDEPDEFSTVLNLSDLFSEDALRLDATKTQLSGWLAGDQSGIGQIYVTTGWGSEDEASWILSAEIGKWVHAWDESNQRDYIEVANTDIIETYYVLEGRQSAELRVVIETDSSEEGDVTGFKLIVKEKDIGRMDVKEQN